MPNKQRGYYTLNLGGKNRTLHFNMNFWAEFTDGLGLKIQDLSTVFSSGGVDLKTLRQLVYSALITYDRENNKEVDYNIWTVGSWMDDMDPGEFENILKAMMESKILGNDLNMGIKRTADKAEKKTKAH